MTPEPTDKLDTATYLVVYGPEGDPPDLEWIVGPHATGPEGPAGRLARPVPRGARRRKAPGLPD
jgi:hypothetical protein